MTLTVMVLMIVHIYQLLALCQAWLGDLYLFASVNSFYT